jgi:hypothetical protein
MIWCLGIDYGVLFSGDSQGSLKIWDSKFGQLRKEFYEHQGDILSIAINKGAVYYSGSDSQIITVQNNNNDWILTSKFRGQSHDINTLCLINDDYLLSGGLTTDICIYKLLNSRFVEKYDKKVSTSIKRHISAFEQKSKIYVNNNENLLILHRGLDKLSLWGIEDEKVTYLAEINKKTDSHIISAAIGFGYICYSDSEATIIFKYDYENNEVKKIKKLKFSSKFVFFKDDNLIALNQENNSVLVYNIKKETLDSIPLPEKEIYISCALNDKLLALSTVSKKLMIVDISKKVVDTNYPSPDNYVTQLKYLNKDTLITVIDDNR